MMEVNWDNTSFFLGFLAGLVSGFVGVILLGHITSWLAAKRRLRYRGFKLGKGLSNVDVPDLLPHEEDNMDL